MLPPRSGSVALPDSGSCPSVKRGRATGPGHVHPGERVGGACPPPGKGALSTGHRGPDGAAWGRGGGTAPSSSDFVALSLPRPGPSVGVSLGVLPPRSGSVALPNSDSCPTVQPCGRASRPSDLRPCAPRGLCHETELHTPQPGSVAQLGRPVSSGEKGDCLKFPRT